MPVAFWPTQLLAMPKIERRLLCTTQASSRRVDLPPSARTAGQARAQLAAMPQLGAIMSAAEPGNADIDFGCRRGPDYRGPEPGTCAECARHNLRVRFATADAAAAFEAAVHALPAATGFVVSTDEVCKVVYNWDGYKLFANSKNAGATSAGVSFLVDGATQTKWLTFTQLAYRGGDGCVRACSRLALAA
jgi:hypothetical protein